MDGDGRGIDRGPRAFAALLALVLVACGPSPWQAATSVLLVTPIAVLVGHALVIALVHLWGPRHPELRATWRTPLVIGALALAAGVTLAVTGSERLRDWPGVALMTFGSSYLVAALLSFRVALALRPGRAAAAAHLSASAIMITPAAIVLIDPSQLDLWLGLWVWTGIYGILPSLLLLAFIVEADWATRRRPGRAPRPPDGRDDRQGD